MEVNCFIRRCQNALGQHTEVICWTGREMHLVSATPEAERQETEEGSSKVGTAVTGQDEEENENNCFINYLAQSDLKFCTKC